jgi:hypothetical protein
MVDRVMEVANQRKDSNISKTLAEDVVWGYFRVSQVYNLLTFCGPSVIECLKRIWMNIWMKKSSGSSTLLTSSAKVGTRRQVCLRFCVRRVSSPCFIDIDIIAYSSYGTYAVLGFAQSGLG